MEVKLPHASLATSSVLLRARNHVLELFNRHADGRLVFHNYTFAVELHERVMDLARGEGLSVADAELASLAAWFIPAGYTLDYQQPQSAGLAEADRFFRQEAYPEEKRQLALNCLKEFWEKQTLSHSIAKVLADGYQVQAYLIDFHQRKSLLRLEGELCMGQHLSDEDWDRLLLQYLLQIQFHTHFARLQFEPQQGRLIRDQKEAFEKRRRTTDQEEGENGEMDPGENGFRRFQQLEKKRYPARATQTFFRVNYRNHINLSAIADNKANIMISVNSILISVLISIMTYRNMAQNQPMLLLPVIIFLVTGLASLIFAVLSARPKVTALNKPAMPKEAIRRNIVFFGNFVHLDLDEYEEAMDSVFRDDELLYGNLTRDLYYLGKVLDKKYRYLSISYNIFMVGFIATVGSFLILLLSSN